MAALLPLRFVLSVACSKVLICGAWARAAVGRRRWLFIGELSVSQRSAVALPSAVLALALAIFVLVPRRDASRADTLSNLNPA